VTIFLFGPTADFEGFLPKVQKVLNTVEWKGHRLVSSDYSPKCVEG
jgi:hypothetical protein